MILAGINAPLVTLQCVATDIDGRPKTDVISGSVRVYHVTALGVEVIDLAATPLVGAAAPIWRYAWEPATLAAGQYIVEYTLTDAAGASAPVDDDLIVRVDATAALTTYGAATAADVAAVPAATAALVPDDTAIEADVGTALGTYGAATAADVSAVPAATAALVPDDVAITADAQVGAAAAIIAAGLATEVNLALVAADVAVILKIERNDWRIVGDEMIFYDDDGVTPLYTFSLTDKDGAACTFSAARALNDVFRRERV